MLLSQLLRAPVGSRLVRTDFDGDHPDSRDRDDEPQRILSRSAATRLGGCTAATLAASPRNLSSGTVSVSR